MGIKTVIIPFANARELTELPEVLRADVRFIPVKTVDEVFALLLEGGKGYNSYRETPQKTEKTAAKPRKKRGAKEEPLPVIPEQPQQDGVRCK